MLYFHLTFFLKDERPQQKWNLEIGPSERLRSIFGTNNRILEVGSCERAFKVVTTPSLQMSAAMSATLRLQ